MRPAIALLTALALSAAVPARAQVALKGSMEFNLAGPAGQYASVANKTGLQGNPDYTIEAWIYPVALGSYQTIVGNDYHTSFWLGLTPTGGIRFYPRGGVAFDAMPSSAVPVNRWTHIAATYSDEGVATVYMNGATVASGNSIVGLPGTSAGDLRIGADREEGVVDYQFRGRIADVRLWSVARSGADIEAMRYQECGRPRFATPAYTGLRASWIARTATPILPVIDWASDATLGEPSNDADYVGGAVNSPQTPPMSFRNACSFDGATDHALLANPGAFPSGISVEAWIAPTAFTNFPTIVGRDYRSSFWLGLSTSGHLRFYPTGGEGQFVESPDAFLTNKWYHVCATYDPAGGVTRLYVRGILVLTSTALSGPVGDNSKPVYLGADIEDLGATLRFTGYIDEVRIWRRVLDEEEIRHGMFASMSGFAPNPEVVRASFDGVEALEVHGTNAKLVNSGAVMFAPLGGVPYAELWDFERAMDCAASLPVGPAFTGFAQEFSLISPPTVSDLDFYLSAPTADLSIAQIRLRSPSGTWVDLLSPGDAHGIEVHTLFDDEAASTLATGWAPYFNGVRPHSPLAAFDGEPVTGGNWRLEITGNATTGRVGMWSFGIRINGVVVDVEPVATGVITLRIAGAQPVRDTGTLAFTLPRAGHVDLTLFDVQGRKARVLTDANGRPGETRVGWSAADLAPGAYFARLRVDGAEAARLKVIVVR